MATSQILFVSVYSKNCMMSQEQTYFLSSGGCALLILIYLDGTRFKIVFKFVWQTFALAPRASAPAVQHLADWFPIQASILRHGANW